MQLVRQAHVTAARRQLRECQNCGEPSAPNGWKHFPGPRLYRMQEDVKGRTRAPVRRRLNRPG